MLFYSMLDKTQIPVRKLKQAYELSEREAYELLGALVPDNVFAHALWLQAYTEFWQWSLQAASLRYRVENPPFPDAVTLPEKYFATHLCRKPILDFFADISQLIDISALERGIDYIIEATYGEEDFPYKDAKESLFKALHQEEMRHDNKTRTSGLLKISSMQAVDYDWIRELFFDTIIVDKIAAVLHLFYSGYSLHREVKGLTHALVERIIADASKPQTMENAPQSPPQAPEDPPPPQTPESEPQVPPQTLERDPQATPQTLESATQPSPQTSESIPQTLEDTPKTQPLTENDQTMPPAQVFKVLRSLWENKTAQAIRDRMRQEELPDFVIAHVLHEWCGETNKTKLGRLLDPDKKDKGDWAYLRLANRLLKQAKTKSIQPA